MAEEREAIFHAKPSSSTILRENDNDNDPSVITVIEKNPTIAVEEPKLIEIYDDAVKKSIDNVKTEVIILDEAPVGKTTRNNGKTCENRRVIELGDTISKMELRRQFKMDVGGREVSAGGSRRNRNRGVVVNGEDDDGSAEILSRLPPGTILIKQRNTSSAAGRSGGREDSDYVHESSKDSTESNSSESSSATLYTPAGKVKRMQHRGTKNKKIVEVRRNPVRNKKKKPIDEDFTRPRQRLLSQKRKSGFVSDVVTRKRAKIAPVPYMNTRSVTRKMYTVGATYQAPTIHDAIEWKEWPSHGMHERPVWHPQFGLTYSYNDRHFLSLDGRTYREIVDDPVIEVVSVDPNSENLLHASVNQDFETTRSNVNYSQIRDVKSINEIKNISFEACMHGSLHSVLAYCARVVAPTYKNAVDAKLPKSNENSDKNKSVETTKLISNLDQNSNKEDKIDASSIKNSETTNPKIASSLSSESTKCLVVPRRTISFTNVRNIQGNILHEVFGRATKNTLIFLKPTDSNVAKSEKSCANAKSVPEKFIATMTKDSAECGGDEESNHGKIEDNSISDEALMEMSSMYNKLLPNENVEITPKTAEVKFAIAANVVSKISETSAIDVAKEKQPLNGILTSYPASRSQDSVVSKNSDSTRISRFSDPNQAAEIAKILAEYNQKAAKNSAKISSGASSMASHARTTKATSGKIEKDRGDNRGVKTAFLSIVGQPKMPKMDDDSIRKTHHVCDGIPKPDNGLRLPVVAENDEKVDISMKTEVSENNADDNSRAIDLSTGKSRQSAIQRQQRQPEIKPEESANQLWLQELIEDTAILYCAAAGVRQNDVADYLDSLDSAQSIEWLGS